MEYVIPSGPDVWAGEDPLILASKSSSRRDLLAAAGLAAEVVSLDIDERAVEERYLAEGGSIDDLAMCLEQTPIKLYHSRRRRSNLCVRQIWQFGPCGFYELFNPRSLVGRQIVHDDDIALREGGNQTFFHPFLEQGG